LKSSACPRPPSEQPSKTHTLATVNPRPARLPRRHADRPCHCETAPRREPGSTSVSARPGASPIRRPAHDHDQRSLWARRPHRHQPPNTKTCSSRVSGIRPPTVSALPRAETGECRVDRVATLHLIASRGAAIVPLLSVANRSKRHSRGPWKPAFRAPPGAYPRRADCLNDGRRRRCSGGRAAVWLRVRPPAVNPCTPNICSSVDRSGSRGRFNQ